MGEKLTNVAAGNSTVKSQAWAVHCRGKVGGK